MKTSIWIRSACMVAALLVLHGGVLAEKPDWAGQGGGKQKREDTKRDEGPREDKSRNERQSDRGGRVDVRIGAYFGDTQRRAVQSHYQEQLRSGACPPGLAKKNNGCLPPGQARQWTLGQALPRDVMRYPLEAGISVRLGVPPAGYEFVRVASDILLIAVGTGMVVDAIKDLGR